jgi:xanthine/uracil/vitamin C permease (AzgA family)
MDDESRLYIFQTASRLAFGLVATVLACFGVVTVVYGVGQTIYAILAWEDVGIAILRGIGYLVISIAVFEVAKYFVEEEVVRRRQMRTPTDARRSLTNFISTISIAIFLEGLVIVFYVSQNDVAGLIYPSILLLTATAMILGLGLYQRMSATVEAQVGHREKAADERQPKSPKMKR